ncbi:GumC family protein [Roseibium sp.]|uniref:GumC family protein n=1 Tax=Roseibium sp. TaxID=1936156 RepID=UPI003A97D4A9
MNDDEIDIRHLLGILRRQANLIIGTIAVILAVAILGVFSITPLYTGTTLILVDPSRKNLLDPASAMASNSTDSARVDSEVELVDSDSVLLSVIQDGITPGGGNLLKDPEFGVKLRLRDKLLAFLRIKDAQLPSGDEALGRVLENLNDRISVDRRGLTYLIAVQAQSEDPQKAANLANAVADTYIHSQLEHKITNAVAARDIVQKQIKDAEQAVILAERNFDSYVFDNVDRFVSDTGRTDLASLRDQIQSIASNRNVLEDKIAGLRANLTSNNLDAITKSLGTEAAAELAQQRADLLKSLDETQTSSPTAVNLRAELKRVEDDLKKEAENSLSAFKATASNYETETGNLRKELNTAILNSNLPPNVLAQIYGLQQVSKNATAQYQTLLARSQALETEAALQIADSRIVSPAFTPTKPSSPKIPLILAVATLFALGAGVAFAFLFENYIGGFTSEGQVEAVTRIPIAAVIPRQAHIQDEHSVADHLVDSPLSMYAESIRRLRVSIDHILQKSDPVDTPGTKKRGRVIMVSSALPGEGKSTIALSLARTLALSGYRTVILDCDLRKPSIQRQLDVAPSNGLVDLLTGKLSPDDLTQIVKDDPKTDLTAVVGDRRANIPTDQLFIRNPFAQLIASASARFDYVILDTPPIEPVVDGLYLAKYADLIAFVVRWAKTPQHQCISSLYKLAEAKRDDAQIVALLNQQESKKLAYYSAYSDYYSE